MNLEEVLRLGKGAPGGKSPLVDFHNVRMNGGTLRIALPWNPDRSLRTQAQKDSALRAERAKPGRTIEDSPEGFRRIILLADLTTRMSRLRIATPDRKPFTIDLDSLATRINDPGRDAARRRRPHHPPRRQRDLQPVARRAPRHPVLRRRRRHLAARHHPLRFPDDLAARESRGPALGVAPVSEHDRQRHPHRAVHHRQPERVRHPGAAAPGRRAAGERRAGGGDRPKTRASAFRDMRLQLKRPRPRCGAGDTSTRCRSSAR